MCSPKHSPPSDPHSWSAAQGHIKILEQGDANKAALLQGLDQLLNISFVPDDEVLKICLDFWHFFVPDVYDSLLPGGPSSLSGALSGSAAALSPAQVSLSHAVLM